MERKSLDLSPWIFFLFSLCYQSFFYRYGLNLWDEGIIYSGTDRLIAGEIVNRDFFGYQMGRYYLLAFFFKLFGRSLETGRLMWVFLTSIMAVLTLLISRRLVSGIWVWIPPILLLAAPSMYYCRFYPFFTVVNLYFLFLLSEKFCLKNFFFSFFSAAVTFFFFREEIGFFSFFLTGLVACEFLFFEGEKPWDMALKTKILKADLLFYLLLSIIFVSLLYLTYPYSFDFHQRLAEYIEVALKTPAYFSTPIPSLLELMPWKKRNFQELFETALFHLPYLLYALTVFHAVVQGRKGKVEKQTALLFLAALLGILVYGLMFYRAGFDALFRVLPPFYLLLAFYLSRADAWMCTRIRNFLPHPGISKKIFGLLKNLLLWAFPLYFIFDVTWNNGFYAGSIGALREDSVRLRMEGANLWVPLYEHYAVSEVVGYIQEHTGPEDYVFAVPLNPIWNFLAKRKNPSYYEWILPGVLRAPEDQEKVVRELEARPPKYIIHADIAIDGLETRRFSNYAAIVYKFILENYTLEKRVDYFHILALRKNHPG